MSSPTSPARRSRRVQRIVHFAGPGDVAGTFEHWKRGEHDPSETSVTYSGQFYDVCERLDLQALLIGCSTKPRRLADGRFRIEHRAIVWDRARGLRWHAGRVLHGLRMICWTLRFRADVVVVAKGTHWFVLAPLVLFGVRIVPTLHNTLWLRSAGSGAPTGLLARLDRWFFRRCCAAILSASHDIGSQVDVLTGGRHAPVVEFLPTYRPETFRDVKPLAPDASPFRVLYVGRIEEAKGVFDLLEICRELTAEGLDVEYDLCGDGAARAALTARAAELGLSGRFRCHGHTRREDVVRFLGESHVLVVPTRTSFTEGFAMTVVEGVLAGRPVVTSDVCPSLRYVKDAAIEVAPDAKDEYRDAVRQLHADRARLVEVSRRAPEAGRAFYDEARGWGRALENVLLAIGEGRPVQPVSWLPR